MKNTFFTLCFWGWRFHVKSVFFFKKIIVVIKWGASHEGMEPILWGKLTLKTPCKDFDLEIVGGLGWIKWLKNGAWKYLCFMQLSMHYIFFDENFIG